VQARNRTLYISYNEKQNGSFSDAVTLLNTLDHVTWFDASAVDPNNIDCPTDIIIRIKGEERYYRGRLLAVMRADSLGERLAKERKYRTKTWQERDQEGQTVRTVFFINDIYLEKQKPREVEGRHPPQRPTYIDLEGGV
jgi:hypothetical protein